MKTCNLCDTSKPLTEFHRKGKGHTSRCKPCAKSYHRQHYLANKSDYISSVKNRAKRNILFIAEYLKDKVCPCGEADPVVMEFHHLRDKRFTISNGARNGYSIKALEAELLSVKSYVLIAIGELRGCDVNGSMSDFHSDRASSNLASRSTYTSIAQLVERHSDTVDVLGATPSRCTI